MKFVRLEIAEEILNAHQTLIASMHREWPQTLEVSTIGYPGGNLKSPHVRTDHVLWFWGGENTAPENEGRYLHWFGRVEESKNQNITVEINSPKSGIDRRISGCFARNLENGDVYLMHSGKIGGGHPGVGKEAFLTWMSPQLFEVGASDGKTDFLFPIMPVQGRQISSSAKFYIEKIARFKSLVRSGTLDVESFKQQASKLALYYAEGRGRRSGQRAKNIDYISRHGEVVDALMKFRSDVHDADQCFLKNIFIDLGVGSFDDLQELYEVKTSSDRSSVYGAVGQLFLHSRPETKHMVLVVPEEPALAEDMLDSLARINVKVLRYRLAEDVTFLDDISQLLA